MKFLAMSRRCPGVGDQQVAALGAAEALQAFKLMSGNVFEQMYFSTDWKGVVLVMQADSRAAAEDILRTLPMVAQGLITFDVYGLTNYDHFSRLFKDEFKTRT
jgi:hypothetical protein